MSICIFFFGYFQWLEQIINIEKKKIFDAVMWVGLLPKQYCEKVVCIAGEWVVLQRFRLKWLGNCIARFPVVLQ